MNPKHMLFLLVGLLVVTSVTSLSYYQSRCFVLANGQVCLNSSSGQAIIEGAKLNWSDILNSNAGGADGNNYTIACSIGGTTTKTAQCSRSGMANFSFSWTDLDTNTENASWTEARANTLYYGITNPLGYYNASTLPAYPTADNTTWNETRANSLYYLLSNPWGFYNSSTIPAYVTTEVDPYYNRTFNHTWVLGLGYITDGNTGWDNTYSLITTSGELDRLWSGNYSLVCKSNGVDCPASSGDNSTWNQTLADSLYYPKNTNPLGFYNSSTIPTYVTSEVDPYYNRTFNHTWVLGLGYITDGNTGWTNEYGLLTTESDPLWTGNSSLYYLKSNPFSFYNSSTIPAYVTASTELDRLWSGNQSSYLTIASYNANSFGFYNTSTALTTVEKLWHGNSTLVYYATNPLGFYNASTAKTTVEALWHGNSTLVYYSTNQLGFYNDTNIAAKTPTFLNVTGGNFTTNINNGCVNFNNQWTVCGNTTDLVMKNSTGGIRIQVNATCSFLRGQAGEFLGAGC